MSTTKKALTITTCIVAFLFLINAFQYKGKQMPPMGHSHLIADTTVIYDTVKVEIAVPRDSIVLRVITQKMPLKRNTINSPCLQNTAEDAAENLAEPDSADVDITISQKKYTGENYTAYISGWHSSLDSLILTTPMTTINIRERPKRWNISLSAGYSITPVGLQPTVGLTVGFTIWRF